MKEYAKTFTAITDADEYRIVDIPFTCTVIGATSPKGRSPQNLVYNRPYGVMSVVDGTVNIVSSRFLLTLTGGTMVELTATTIGFAETQEYKSNITHAEIGSEAVSFEEAFSNCYNLKTVKIHNGVKSISENAFRNSAIESIEIPNSINKLESGSFMYCSALTSITIPNEVKTIESFTFNGCSGLTSINIPNGCRVDGRYLFEGCSSLTSVTFPSDVYFISDECTFKSCTSLVTINMPSNLNYIDSEQFRECISLTSITIPSTVEAIGFYSFMDCTSLSVINYGGTSQDWSSIDKDIEWHLNVPSSCVVHCIADNVDIPIDNA